MYLPTLGHCQLNIMMQSPKSPTTWLNTQSSIHLCMVIIDKIFPISPPKLTTTGVNIQPSTEYSIAVWLIWPQQEEIFSHLSANAYHHQPNIVMLSVYSNHNRTEYLVIYLSAPGHHPLNVVMLSALSPCNMTAYSAIYLNRHSHES